MKKFKDRIKKLRVLFKKYELDAYLIPTNDEFFNEFPPLNKRRLEWLTGFSGSNGIAIITKVDNFLMTDGRYLIQAKNQLLNDFKILDMRNTQECTDKLLKSLQSCNIGFDPMLHTEKNLLFYERLFRKVKNFKLKPINQNLIDLISPPSKSHLINTVKSLDAKYVEINEQDKIDKILKKIDKKADFLFITDLASICWLLNIRGNDVPYTPFLLSYLLLHKSGQVELFTNIKKLKDSSIEIKFSPLEKTQERYKEIILQNKIVQLDPSTTPVWFTQNGAIDLLIKKQDPCILQKAQKNRIELAGIKYAHIQDGIAMCKFLYWLEHNVNANITELDASEKLLSLRKERTLFEYPSFCTISASGANGAIIHYNPTKETNSTIEINKIYLVDSGGQYMNGTTDVTRTLCFSPPSEIQKLHYTLVLKGHINLALAKFPKGAKGAQLDALARQYLWENGLDYPHGTGHGVGHFLSVHEGPQSISQSSTNTCALMPGMLITNEPGYYKENKYGIRIENIMIVKQSKFEGFLEFETITFVPIQFQLIDFTLLTEREKLWLLNYHIKTRDKLAPYLQDEEVNYIKKHINSYKKLCNLHSI